MRCLLIAYEFPPIPAAQALRWYYLANQLAKRGVKVDVLTVAIPDVWGGKWDFHPNINIIRSYPGPFIGLTSKLSNYFKTLPTNTGTPSVPTVTGVPLSIRLYGLARSILNHVLFPDVRSEWYWFGWGTLKKQHAKHPYDIIISSHEPGVDLLIGMRAAKKFKRPWLVDFGDPLLAPYTPRWRRWLDRYVEKQVCVGAQQLIVTTAGMRSLLAERHKKVAPVALITQGYSLQHAQADQSQPKLADQPLILLFTGNFYQGFREPNELFAAVRNVTTIRLQIMGEQTAFAQAAAKGCDRIEFVGKVDHFKCLMAQRKATILVNIGNVQAYQIPGKLYEYLGAQRPILHISQTPFDVAIELLTSLNRGRSVSNRQDAIEQVLQELADAYATGQLDAQYDLSLDTVKAYSWAAAGERLHAICCALHKAVKC